MITKLTRLPHSPSSLGQDGILQTSTSGPQTQCVESAQMPIVLHLSNPQYNPAVLFSSQKREEPLAISPSSLGCAFPLHSPLFVSDLTPLSLLHQIDGNVSISNGFLSQAPDARGLTR